jgi:hypothetical protein
MTPPVVAFVVERMAPVVEFFTCVESVVAKQVMEPPKIDKFPETFVEITVEFPTVGVFINVVVFILGYIVTSPFRTIKFPLNSIAV